MSSGQVYPAMTTIDPGQMGTDAALPVGAGPWYTPESYPFAPETTDAYMTPYTSSMDSQAWPAPFNPRVSLPDITTTPYGQMDPPQAPGPSPPVTKDPNRPKSSPSTFGPSADTISWTTSTGLGIQGVQYVTTGGQPTPPVTSTFPPNVFTHYPPEDNYRAPSTPPLHAPRPQRPHFTNIAPSPHTQLKRKLDDDGPGSGRDKKRGQTSSVASADLSEEDRFLVQLKEDENLPWKDIAARFQTDKGKPLAVAALQMRYKRLREKFRVWEEQDLQALKLAHEYWEKYKWEIISAKMLDFGIQERWPARHCARKWQELEVVVAAQQQPTPVSLSQFSSPAENASLPPAGATHFAFIPNYHHHQQHQQQ